MKDEKHNIKAYLQPTFIICVIVLAFAGTSMSIAINNLGMYLKKEPLPLKKSLALLDENGLSPYNIQPHNKLKILNEEIIRTLGTQEYIQWILEDEDTPVNSSVYKCLLFITYYDCPDKVPHVPEECWTGGGFRKLSSESITLYINNYEGFKLEIPAKYLVFGPQKLNLLQSSIRIPNLYFFIVNGQYVGSREAARRALNKNLFGKYSYFSKLELVFNQISDTPDKDEAILASEKLLSVVLPVLEKEHLPDL
jgi:hypothetical protein